MRTYGNGLSVVPEDNTRCIEKVWDKTRYGVYQCSRKRGYGEDRLYCKQHDPANVKAKRDARDAKWKKEMKASIRSHERPIAFKKALEEIAKGELNDPAGYAQMIIDEFEEKS